MRIINETMCMPKRMNLWFAIGNMFLLLSCLFLKFFIVSNGSNKLCIVCLNHSHNA
jgi:hypothetical protein